MKISLTSVFVNNPNEAFIFYTEKLGFISKLHMPEAQLAIVVSPEEEDGTALLLEPNTGYGAKEFQQRIYNAGIPVIVFGTDDIYKEFERLKSRGVIFNKEPTKTDYGLIAEFDDTCGNYIQIAQTN